MQPTINNLSNWVNPVTKIKDPLKRRWAEICQVMDTHINGVCPLHIYVNKRPLESTSSFALEYRANNFEPNTQDPFDKAFSGIIEVCTEANIEVKTPEVIKNTDIEIDEKDVYYYCLNDLVRVRENDPNAVIVVLPKIKSIDELNVSIVGVDVLRVASADIDTITKYSIRFKAGEVKYKDTKYDYFYNIEGGQYTLEYPDEKGKLESFPLVLIQSDDPPYTYISTKVVYEGKYKLRLPYLHGAAAWGNKYYGNDSDVMIQEVRNTYIKEIRAKEKCNEIGSINDPTGKYAHINATTNKPCAKCKGMGYVKDDSPLTTIYIDYDRLTAEGKTIPTAISYVEPPQAALTNAQARVDIYFDRMCEALGLLKQNLTNASADNRSFDYKQQLRVIYTILMDNLMVLKYIYRQSERFLNIGTESTSDVYLVGEIGKSSLEELLEKLKQAKDNMSPPSVIVDLIDQIHQKTINPYYSDLVIEVAKKYDKLYIYGADEITTARANLGNVVDEKMVTIHNTVIGVIEEFLNNNEETDVKKIINYLDAYYKESIPVSVALL